MTKRILITGSEGYLGSKLIELLKKRGGWRIFGIDVREPRDRKIYERYAKGSVAQDIVMQECFDRTHPDVAVHLAFMVNATHDRRLEEDVDVGGARNFLECVARDRVAKAVFLSSVAAYGAHDNSRIPITEEAPLRGVEGYGYSHFKAKADALAQKFAAANEWCKLVILRPCLFVGPGTDNNFFDVLKFPVVPQVKDKKGARDPAFQFIHEDDMAACLLAAIEKDVRGIYNVAAEGEARFTDLVRIFGKKCIPLPAWLLYPVTALLWKLHLVTSPPAQLDFIRYPWIMDASKMRRDLYTPAKNTLQSFEEFAKAHR